MHSWWVSLVFPFEDGADGTAAHDIAAECVRKGVGAYIGMSSDD